jgi:hypothetical protein
MIRPIAFRAAAKEHEFVPQATFGVPPAYFEARGLEFVSDIDDLDYFEGTAFLLEGNPVALMHYRGHSDGTTTMYLPEPYADVRLNSEIVGMLRREFGLPRQAILWQRSVEPEPEAARAIA